MMELKQMKPESEKILKHLTAAHPELSECVSEIEAAFDLIADCYRAGGKLLICGNGGSAADCEHITGELMKGFNFRRPLPARDLEKLAAAGKQGEYLGAHLQGALPAISLVSHSGLCTAFANDVASDMIFAQQVYGYGKPGDILIALSTSGNSKNVVNAVLVAECFGLKTIGMAGSDGGKLRELCDVCIRVPKEAVYEVQEEHLPVYHALCAMAETEFFSE